MRELKWIKKKKNTGICCNNWTFLWEERFKNTKTTNLDSLFSWHGKVSALEMIYVATGDNMWWKTMITYTSWEAT